jgi:hypothetical protein
MVSFSSKQASSRARVALAISSSALAVAFAASGGGCTLIVGGALSDKPSEGAGGQGGEGGASSSVSASSSAAQSSSGAGGFMCAPDTANCDGLWINGCETKLKSDSKNCGACKNVCEEGKHCKESKCQ